MSVLGKLFRNWDFLRELVGFAIATSQERRLRHLGALRAWTAEKEAVESFQLSWRAAKGKAASLLSLDDLERHLTRTPHLGTLADLAPHWLNRGAYVTRQLEILLQLKQLQPTLGLGSRIDGLSSRPTGLELTQAWAMLMSYGHLFGTHSTERALLFELRRTRTLRDQFLSSFGEHSRLASRMYHSTDIYRVAELLALRRVARHAKNEAREFGLEAIRAFEDKAFSHLRMIFGLARRLAYLEAHSLLGLEPAVTRTMVDSTIARVTEDPSLAFVSTQHEASPFDDLTRSIDAFQFASFFTSAKSSARVLQHLREFKVWWTGRKHALDAIDELHARPSDWPARGTTTELESALRFELPRHPKGWVHEVEYWWQGGAAWQPDANFFITHTPRSDSLVCDVFCKRTLSCREIHHLLDQFARYDRSDHLKHDQRKKISRALAKVLVYVLELKIRPGLRVTIRPIGGETEHLFATAGFSPTAVSARVSSLADDPKLPETRRDELKTCSDYLGELAADEGAIFVLQTGSLFLHDETGREVAEIDGVVLVSTPSKTTFHVLEVKASSLSGSKKQLNRIGESLGCGPLELRDYRFHSGQLRAFQTEIASQAEQAEAPGRGRDQKQTEV